MFEYIHSSFPERKCSYLKWSLLWNSWSYSNSSKAWLALNTFTLHLPNENVLQSSQSSLKLHLLWNEVFSEMKPSLKLVVVFELFEGVVGFEYIHYSFPDRKRSTEYTDNFNGDLALSNFSNFTTNTHGTPNTRFFMGTMVQIAPHQLHVFLPIILKNANYPFFSSQFWKKYMKKCVFGIPCVFAVKLEKLDNAKYPLKFSVYPIFSEMKSSLKLVIVFELFEGVVGFEYIHSSFPDRKSSPEYPIFSEMKSSLRWSLLSESTGIFSYSNSDLVPFRPPWSASLHEPFCEQQQFTFWCKVYIKM